MLSIKKQIRQQVIPGSYEHDLKSIVNDDQIIINIERVHLNKIITSCSKSLSKLENIRYTKNYFDDEQCHFYSDPFLIKSIISQLLNNAVQYRDPNRLSHLITIDVIDKGHMVLIDIIDNGVGIANNIRGKVFDKFFVGNPNSSGYGIGLYRVKTILDRLNGKVSIDSAENIGTHCRVEIPNSLTTS